MLYALRETGPDADRLRELLSRPVENDDELAEALRLLRRLTGHGEGQGDRGRSTRAQARDELANLPDGPGRQALATLVDYTVNRHG